MSAFAKIFERDGEQVLVRKDTTGEGLMSVSLTFELADAWATLHIGMRTPNKALQQTLFDETAADNAFGIRDKFLSMQRPVKVEA